ncbi:MAG: hypothetical protein ACTH0S_06645 [Senegalia sp. (in: firmicutes)]
MSNFLKKGKRKDIFKNVKTHKKDVFRIINDLKGLSKEVFDAYPDIDLNSKKEIKEKAKEFTGREMDSLEVIILMNNIRNLKVDGEEKGN